MTITEQLEGMLPADGPMTKNERIIAEAVGELRGLEQVANEWRDHAEVVTVLFRGATEQLVSMGDRKPWKLIALAIASGIAVGVVV